MNNEHEDSLAAVSEGRGAISYPNRVGRTSFSDPVVGLHLWMIGIGHHDARFPRIALVCHTRAPILETGIPVLHGMGDVF